MKMPKFYTVKEVAEIFRKTKITIYNWIAEDRINAIKVRDGYLIPEDEVNRLITEGKIKENW